MSRYVGSVLVCALILCCKPTNANDSKPTFDSEIAGSLENLELSRSTVRTICQKNPIFIFVGNYEDTAAQSTKTVRLGSEDLRDTINLSVKQLEKSLAQMNITCDLEMSTLGQTPSNALLLVITDGPRRFDSTIFTSWYTFDKDRPMRQHSKKGQHYSSAWASTGRDYWEIKPDGKLLAKKEGETQASEIHLPTQLQTVVKQALQMKPPGRKDFAFDQTIYFIKSHGGRFVSTKTPPNLASYYEMANGTLDEGLKYNHAFLFDPNGPTSGSLAAELFSPSISTEKACAAFNKFTTGSAPSTKICTACKDVWEAADEGFLVKGCKSGGGEGAHGSSNAKILSPDMNSTLSPDMNSTLSPDMNSTLSPDMNSTLSPDMNSTLSPDMNSTLSPDMNSTLASGKGTLFTSAPSDIEAWDDLDQLAAAVSYKGDTSVAGITKIRLPLSGTNHTPPLVVLDSCWGSEELVAGAFELLDAETPAVVMVNENPMALNAVDYGALDYFQYLALPYIQNEFYFPTTGQSTQHESIAMAKRDIDEHIEQNGLIGMDNFTLDNSVKKVKIYVLRDGKVFQK